jgi:hypothetical protein
MFKIKYLYVLLCFFGLFLPYSQFIPILLEGNFSIQMFLDQLFINRVSTLFALDLLVTALVFVLFALYEGRKLKIKYLWIPIFATILVGASLGFPLFLYLREIHLEKNNNK